MRLPSKQLEQQWLELLDRLANEIEANYGYLRRLSGGPLDADRMRFTVAIITGMALRQLRAAQAVVAAGWGLESLIYGRAVLGAAYDLAFLLSTSGEERRGFVGRYLRLRWLRADVMQKRSGGEGKRSRSPGLLALTEQLREEYVEDPTATAVRHWSGLRDNDFQKRARRHLKTFLPEELHGLPKTAERAIGTVGGASIHGDPSATTLVPVGNDGLPKLDPDSPMNLQAAGSQCVAAAMLLAAVTQRSEAELRERATSLYREVGELIRATGAAVREWAEERDDG